MAYLLGLIGALIGGLFFYKNKAQSAGSLLENTKTKEALNESNAAIAANEGRRTAEHERISALQDISKVETEKVLTNEELASRFNDLNKRK